MSKPPFAVVTDGGMDAFWNLENNVPVAPFSVNFGSESFRMDEIKREELFHQLQTNPVHPTSNQPSPQQWLNAFQQAGQPEILAVTISSGLSGSRNAAEQARDLAAGHYIRIHDAGTLSAAQAFQVHAAQSAALRGESMDAAIKWMQAVHQETELYFTIETLEYLKRGGRIGRVQATLGGLLNLKPVITVDKTSGTYVNVSRARSYKGAISAIADQVTRQYGEGTPLRLGILYGIEPQDAEDLLVQLQARHPIVWVGKTGVNPVLTIHVGPRAMGVAAAPGPWPWERPNPTTN